MHENFQKQTFRNRTEILSANGKLTLIIPVIAPNNLPYKDVIEESKLWQIQHIRAIRAAYNRTPFFEYYPELIELIAKPEKSLLTKNLNIIIKINELLGLPVEIIPTHAFVKLDPDYRRIFKPSKFQGIYKPEPYYQNFGEKFSFTPHLSILDLIYNLGPESLSYLKKLANSSKNVEQ